MRFVFSGLAILTFTSLFIFQNCAPGLESGDGTYSSSGAADVLHTGQDLSVVNSDPPRFVYDSNHGAPVSNKSDILITPSTLVEMPNSVKVIAPGHCVNTCIAEMGCGSLVDATEKKMCQSSCSRDTGLCAPYELPNDPHVLTSFTVPPGYKKAEVTLEHCTDRQDMLILEGPNLYFKTLNPARLHVGNGWSNMRFLGANVGRGSDCQKLGLRDIVKVKVRTQDSDGNFNPEEEYIWKMPAALGFSFTMIKDIDLTKPVFANFTKVEGPGIKIVRIYDNNLYNKQLSFLVEYLYWYDPKYTTTFDFYYKKGMGYTDF